MPDQGLDKAVRLVLAALPQDAPLSEAQVREECEAVHAMLARRDGAPDLDELVRQVESRVVVWQEQSVSLQDSTGHEDWLAARRGVIGWQ